jgi:hypothetical protein
MQILIPAYWWTFAWYFTHLSSKFQSTHLHVSQGHTASALTSARKMV